MAIEALYDRFYGELVRFAAGMTGERAKAEDLVQEAFFRAVLHEAEVALLDESRARAWLYRTVKNAFFDVCRKARFEQATETFPETPAPDGDFSEVEWKLLLDTLPSPMGEMLWLHDVEGRTSEAIGGIYRMPPGTVRYKLSLARKQLKRMIGGSNDGKKESADQL